MAETIALRKPLNEQISVNGGEEMDREKVIRIIDELIFEAQKESTWKAENALRCLKKELLKEQEAVKPIAKEDDTYECICGAIVGWDELDASGIVQTRLNYCPFCGRSVKWNDLE